MLAPSEVEKQAAKPLIMGTRSIIAWQQGAKTQTRRLVRPEPLERLAVLQLVESMWFGGEALGDALFELKYQPYAVGDLVWIRERLRRFRKAPDMGGGMLVVYEADGRFALDDGQHARVWTWKPDKLPAIFMPKWACRYYAKVVSVRPERLREMLHHDAVMEGTLIGLEIPFGTASFRDLYFDWWNELHKKPGTRSEDNPWVWIYGLEAANDRTR